MARTWDDEAIILRTWPVGEIHAGVVLLTQQRGLVQAVAHGARSARGSLRSSCQAMNTGQVYVYEDPVKQSLKLKEILVQNEHGPVKACLEKYLLACVWLELLSKVAVEGAWEFELLLESLGILGDSDLSRTQALGVQFAMRFLEHSGLWPDPAVDCRSGLGFAPAEGAELSAVSGGFVLCHQPWQALDAGTRRYASHSLGLEMAAAVAIGLDQGQVLRFHHQLLDFIQAQYQVKLQSRGMLV